MMSGEFPSRKYSCLASHGSQPLNCQPFLLSTIRVCFVFLLNKYHNTAALCRQKVFDGYRQHWDDGPITLPWLRLSGCWMNELTSVVTLHLQVQACLGMKLSVCPIGSGRIGTDTRKTANMGTFCQRMILGER